MLCHSDTLHRTAASEHALAISCLGACTHYLRKCLIDFQVACLVFDFIKKLCNTKLYQDFEMIAVVVSSA